MKLTADYHVHSIYSRHNHGKSTIEEIVQRAAEMGLAEIAITDHGPKHYMYGIKEDKIKEAKEKVLEMRAKYPQLKILLGIEANLLDYDGNVDISDEVLKYSDIILCGYHAGALFSTPGDAWSFLVNNKIGKINKKMLKDITEKNTNAIVAAMRKNKIDILTHPGDKIPVYIDKIAAVAQETGTILEINNSHSHLNAEEIKIASKYDVKFAINSDAHVRDDIGSYKKGLKAAVEAGLDLSRIVNIEV